MISKYLAEECTQTELEEIQAWMNASPENAQQVEEMERLWVSTKKSQIISTDTEGAWSKLGHSIERKSNNQTSWLKYAAVLIPVVLVSVFLLQRIGSSQIEIINEEDNPMQVFFSDSSSVWLRTGASITFPKNFNGKEREVLVKGEGYFDIREDKNRPFIVQFGPTQIEVLGTEFNLKTTSKSFEVAVYEGVVSFSKRNQTETKEILKVNEKAAFSGSEQKIERIAMDPNEVAWKTGILKFNGISIPDIVDKLRSHYNINIKLDGDLNTCQLTTVFDNLTVKECLSIIEATNDLNLEETSSGFALSGDCSQ